MAWRAATLPHLKRVQILDDWVGSVGPAKKGKWMNRDTGQEFDTIVEAKADVEKYLNNACTYPVLAVY